MKKALVTGSTGFLGSFLVEELLENDRDVFCMVRQTSDLRWIRDLDVEYVPWDVTGGQPVPDVIGTMDEVYHAAGVVTACGNTDLYYRVNAGGVKHMLDALHEKEAELDRFLLISSLAAAGPSRRREARLETDTCRPINHYGRSKRAGEKMLYAHRGSFPCTIIRPPIIIGPRDEMVLDIIRLVENGIFPVIGRKKKYSFICVHDLVKGIRQAADAEMGKNRTYFLSHPDPVPWEELATQIGEHLHIDPTLVPLPNKTADLLGFLGSYASFVPGLPETLTPDKAKELKQASWICSPARAREELGFSCSYDLERTLSETIDWYDRMGWIQKRDAS